MSIPMLAGQRAQRPAVCVALVGSGPSGFYTADALTRLLPSARIHFYERLSQPGGLLRYGVAPDHLATKALLRLFERIMARPGVEYFGGISVGEDISLQELEQAYDAVVIATGAASGRRQEIERAPDSLSTTALNFANWLNGHPYAHALARGRPIRHVCIIGNGNVSLDVARLLALPSATLRALGVAGEALDWHRGLALERLTIVGRGAAATVKFSPAELRALESLERFCPIMPHDRIGAAEPGNACLEALRGWPRQADGNRRPIDFRFGLRVERQERDRLECRDADWNLHALPCDLMIEAIGQVAAGLSGLERDATGAVRHEQGVLANRRASFVVGWSAGHQSNIAGIREVARLLAPRIVQRIQVSSWSSGDHPDALIARLPSKTIRRGGIQSAEIGKQLASQVA